MDGKLKISMYLNVAKFRSDAFAIFPTLSNTYIVTFSDAVDDSREVQRPCYSSRESTEHDVLFSSVILESYTAPRFSNQTTCIGETSTRLRRLSVV